MAEKPILFSGPMVRALIANRKTQTRRVVVPQPSYPEFTLPVQKITPMLGRDNMPNGEFFIHHPECDCVGRSGLVARYLPGDKLWVRETWCQYASRVIYRADYDRFTPISDGIGGPWRPSIFMPRSASRITLEVTDVRVQRVQEISEEDARAEGTEEPSLCELGGMLAQAAWSERQVYQRLWDFINAKRGFGWAANPWVFAYTFKEVSRG